jgi:hypothetical protein
VQLARDLQADFQPHFYRIFDALADILCPMTAEKTSAARDLSAQGAADGDDDEAEAPGADEVHKTVTTPAPVQAAVAHGAGKRRSAGPAQQTNKKQRKLGKKAPTPPQRNLQHVASPEALEAAFSALAFFFKFLRREVLEDIDAFFAQRFARLLSPMAKPYVREFAAESYAFLLRKASDDILGRHLPLIMRSVAAEVAEEAAPPATGALAAVEDSGETPEASVAKWPLSPEGAGAVLAHSLKHVRNAFHSRTSDFLPLWLKQLRPVKGAVCPALDQVATRPAFVAAHEGLRQLLEYATPESAVVIFSALHAEVDRALESVASDAKKKPRANVFLAR